MSAASRHLAELGAYARPAGSDGADRGRRYCAAVLRAAGFVVTEHEFEYSKAAGAWAMPIAGVAVSMAAIGIYLGRWVAHVTVPSVAGLALALAALAWVGGNGVLDLPVLRARGVNLRAARAGVEPRVWLVAHVDSKWQPVSMMLRVAGIVTASVGLIGLLGLAIADAKSGPVLPAALLIATWLGAVPLMLSVIGDNNHGTLDNASGVAAVLEAAELLAGTPHVGVLITDAEELALAGARAWARTNPASVALNCDSVDDDGALTVMYTRAAPGRLLALLVDAASAEGEPLRSRRLIPGILTDSVALASAGWETLTLSRGNLRTLGRIHTSRDTLAAMRGTGIAGAARVLARTATELG